MSATTLAAARYQEEEMLRLSTLVARAEASEVNLRADLRIQMTQLATLSDSVLSLEARLTNADGQGSRLRQEAEDWKAEAERLRARAHVAESRADAKESLAQTLREQVNQRGAVIAKLKKELTQKEEDQARELAEYVEVSEQAAEAMRKFKSLAEQRKREIRAAWDREKRMKLQLEQKSADRDNALRMGEVYMGELDETITRLERAVVKIRHLTNVNRDLEGFVARQIAEKACALAVAADERDRALDIQRKHYEAFARATQNVTEARIQNLQESERCAMELNTDMTVDLVLCNLVEDVTSSQDEKEEDKEMDLLLLPHRGYDSPLVRCNVKAHEVEEEEEEEEGTSYSSNNNSSSSSSSSSSEPSLDHALAAAVAAAHKAQPLRGRRGRMMMISASVPVSPSRCSNAHNAVDHVAGLNPPHDDRPPSGAGDHHHRRPSFFGRFFRRSFGRRSSSSSVAWGVPEKGRCCSDVEGEPEGVVGIMNLDLASSDCAATPASPNVSSLSNCTPPVLRRMNGLWGGGGYDEDRLTGFFDPFTPDSYNV